MVSFNNSYINSILGALKSWADLLVPLLIGLAVVGLFWGIVQYVWGGAENKDRAKNLMIWGIIAVAVMVSIWGLIGLLQGSFLSGASYSTPTFPQLNSSTDTTDPDQIQAGEGGVSQ